MTDSRIVLIFLGLVALLGVLGLVVLGAMGKPTPGAVETLVSVAVGALAGVATAKPAPSVVSTLLNAPKENTP